MKKVLVLILLALCFGAPVHAESSKDTTGKKNDTTSAEGMKDPPPINMPVWHDYTFFTFAITEGQKFYYWFGDKTFAKSADTILGEWMSNLEILIAQNGPMYGSIDLMDFKSRLENLQNVLQNLPGISFKDLILTQNSNGLKSQIASLLPDLDLGFLDLDEDAIAQFNTMLNRERTLNTFKKGGGPFQSGIGDMTIDEMYNTPASVENVPAYEKVYPNGKDAQDQHNGKLGNLSRFGKKECDDTGDIVTVLNASRILWKRAFDPIMSAPIVDSNLEASAARAAAAPAATLTDLYPCCCNNSNHTIANGYLQDFYRTCVIKNPSSTGTCVTCGGSCCLAGVSWCGIFHFCDK